MKEKIMEIGPNGEKKFYRSGRVFSLILSVIFFIFSISFAWTFVASNETIPFILKIFIIAPLIVAIFLLKNFLKPKPILILNSRGIEINESLIKKPIYFAWQQIIEIVYNEEYHVKGGKDLYLLFKIRDNKEYEFNLASLYPKEREKLEKTFEEYGVHYIKPVEDFEQMSVSSQPDFLFGVSNMRTTADGKIKFYRAGRSTKLSAMFVVIVIAVVLRFMFDKSMTFMDANICWFFMSLPLWVIALILGKDSLFPFLIFTNEDISFCPIRKDGMESNRVKIKWQDILKISLVIREVGPDSLEIFGAAKAVAQKTNTNTSLSHRVQCLNFSLKDKDFVLSLRKISIEDYSEIRKICDLHKFSIK